MISVGWAGLWVWRVELGWGAAKGPGANFGHGIRAQAILKPIDRLAWVQRLEDNCLRENRLRDNRLRDNRLQENRLQENRPPRAAQHL